MPWQEPVGLCLLRKEIVYRNSYFCFLEETQANDRDKVLERLVCSFYY